MSIAGDKRSDMRVARVSDVSVTTELWITGPSPHCLALAPHLIIHTVWNIFPPVQICQRVAASRRGQWGGRPCGANLGDGDMRRFLRGVLLYWWCHRHVLSPVCSACCWTELSWAGNAQSRRMQRTFNSCLCCLVVVTKRGNTFPFKLTEHSYQCLQGQKGAVKLLSSFGCFPGWVLSYQWQQVSADTWFMSPVSIRWLLLPQAPEELSSQNQLSWSLPYCPPHSQCWPYTTVFSTAMNTGP